VTTRSTPRPTRQIGAAVITGNVRDFELLHRFMPFDLEPFEEASGGMTAESCQGTTAETTYGLRSVVLLGLSLPVW
jgi:hypothetical protein